MTHYETLKIEKDASADEIKRAYYKSVRQFPPERFPDEFRAIREAYDVLADGERRTGYDYGLEKHDRTAGNLPAEAIEQMESIKTEIKRAHTGKAVKIAEKLYEQHPDNAAVITLLAQAYSARGWTNKALNLAVSPNFLNALQTAEDWEIYSLLLESSGFSETAIFAKTIEGILALSKIGADSIDMCAWAYCRFGDFKQKELSELAIPEEFDTPLKLLNYALEISKRGLETRDSDALINNLLFPIIESKNPSSLNEHDMKQLKIIIKIIKNVVDEKTLKKSEFQEILQGIEHITDPRYEPVQRMEPIRVAEKPGRNSPCPCGSGKKYKKCCAR
jgi:curved DNA-binding protein CbpA